MATCSCCGVAETMLYINGVPVCLNCDNHAKTLPSVPPRIAEINKPLKAPLKEEHVEMSAVGSAIHAQGEKDC
jgi:hypothetical protein